jgi:antitoxin Phd_YefM of type II toxin-antitoxin system
VLPRIAKSNRQAVRAAGADLAKLTPVGREWPTPRNSVPISAFRNNFGHYLDRVERGAIFQVLRRGKVVAVLGFPSAFSSAFVPRPVRGQQSGSVERDADMQWRRRRQD